MKTSFAGFVLFTFCLASTFGQAQNLTNASQSNMTSLNETKVATSATHFVTPDDPIPTNEKSIRIIPALLAPGFAFMAIASYGLNLARHSNRPWDDPVGVFAEAFTTQDCFPAFLTLGLSLGSVIAGSFLTYDLVKTMS